jgi:hypothetical protein
MAIEFRVPDLGENIDSADVGQILVKEGETISAGKNVLELETEKAVFEVECPHHHEDSCQAGRYRDGGNVDPLDRTSRECRGLVPGAPSSRQVGCRPFLDDHANKTINGIGNAFGGHSAGTSDEQRRSTVASDAGTGSAYVCCPCCCGAGSTGRLSQR